MPRSFMNHAIPDVSLRLRSQQSLTRAHFFLGRRGPFFVLDILSREGASSLQSHENLKNKRKYKRERSLVQRYRELEKLKSGSLHLSSSMQVSHR